MAIVEKTISRKPENVVWFRDVHPDVVQTMISNIKNYNGPKAIGWNIENPDVNTAIETRIFEDQASLDDFKNWRLSQPEQIMRYQYNLENNIITTSTTYTV